MRIAEHVDVTAPPSVVWEQVSDPASFSGLGLRKVTDVEQLPADAPSVRASYIAFAGPRPDQWISVTVGQSLSRYSRTMRSFLLRDPVAMTVGGGHLATFGTDGRVQLDCAKAWVKLVPSRTRASSWVATGRG